MDHAHAHAHGDGHGHAHAVDHSKEPKLYAGVLGILLVLTFLTVGASYIKFEASIINVIIALTIATIKATLVALFFMHLLHDKLMNSLVLLTSFFLLGLFLLSCYTDVSSRDPMEPQNLKIAQPAAPGTPGAPGAPGAATAPGATPPGPHSTEGTTAQPGQAAPSAPAVAPPPATHH